MMLLRQHDNNDVLATTMMTLRTRASVRGWTFVAILVSAIALSVRPGEAHKPITSKYTYNDDVFPILREKCSRCHVTGGVAPMSLMTYDEAFPWAESIRAELVAAHMPPATPEPGYGETRRAHALSPKETDVILTWATGGNPRGALDQHLPAVTLKNDWSIGKPDLDLPLPSTFELPADKMEETREFTLATGTSEPRWIRAIDLLPGTPAIVRSAVIYLKGMPDHVLAYWIPGQDPEPVGAGAAFKLPAGAEIVARIHYKKTWQYEGKRMTDRSTVGIYFAKGDNEQEITALPVTSPALPPRDAGQDHQAVTFSRTLDEDVRALALSPEEVPDNVTLQVEAVRPDGSRSPMIRVAGRPDWNRRYWFQEPLALPRGTRIEVTANMEDPDLMAAAFGGPASAKPSGPASVRLALDVVRVAQRPSAP
jgi:hypothetical protein